MKLQCQVEVINRLYSNLNFKSKGKYIKSTLALGKACKNEIEYFIIHFSSVQKTGIKYKINFLKQVFVKFLNEGKATLRFEEPPHDLCIKSEAIQLKCFMRVLRCCVSGQTKELQVIDLSNISVLPKENNPKKLIIQNRNDFPTKGLPRTLESLHINGLNICNFRRDILLLKNLLVLDLSNNKIEKLPLEFGRMTNLCELFLSNNEIGVKGQVDWRWLLGPQITKTLKLLDLSGNKLRHIPKAIWKLQKLVTLKLDNNLIEKLPPAIGRCSALRYLTVSQNEMSSLPCSLLQCHLEYIDISSNKFMFKEIDSQNNNTLWELFVDSLVSMASKVILKHKLYYASHMIPFTLVDYLDNANMCVCGMPVVDTMFYGNKIFELKDYFPVVVFDINKSSMVQFDCYFCSSKCYRKNIM